MAHRAVTIWRRTPFAAIQAGWDIQSQKILAAVWTGLTTILASVANCHRMNEMVVKVKQKPVEAPEVSLAERLKQARAEADAFIDAKTAELKASPDGKLLPIGVLRQMITRGERCACVVALALLAKDEPNG